MTQERKFGQKRRQSRLSMGAENKSQSIFLQINGYGKAEIPKAKLTEYALNPQKAPDKALAFRLALGYTKENVDELVENIIGNINNFEIIRKEDNGYGDRYQIVLDLTGANGKTASVLTAWIMDKDAGLLRLTSLYVKKRKDRGSDKNA